MPNKSLVGAVLISVSALCVLIVLLWLTTSVAWTVLVRDDAASLLLGYTVLATPLLLLLYVLVRKLKATTSPLTPLTSPTPPDLPTPTVLPVPQSPPTSEPATQDNRCYKCGTPSPGGQLCEDCSFEQFSEGCKR